MKTDYRFINCVSLLFQLSLLVLSHLDHYLPSLARVVGVLMTKKCAAHSYLSSQNAFFKT